ncbi:MAG: hypothetical protein CMJ81_16530 [Planctomycetaceae bacterium]|nr:hypothetical protein [Planctomycetaceae bacterium]MBP62491.1 hypothetical protein [Planctomycetaceae bacterium]
MTTAIEPTRSLHPIERKLSGLRIRIRLYVLIQSLGLAIIWLGVTFWTMLALDYLPVLLCANELPQAMRALLLLFVSVGLISILYRWLLRRMFVPLPDRSMALLVERRFSDFQDSLLTAVELATTGWPESQQKQMITESKKHAAQRLSGVPLRRVFNMRPLFCNLIFTTTLVTTFLSFGYFQKNAWTLAVRRLYLISEEPWPRRTSIRVADFTDNRHKVARGSNFTVRVFADAEKYVPDYCTIHYRTEEGDRGKVRMLKRGRAPREGQQAFVYDGVPFKAMLSTVHFDVQGFDQRLRHLTVEVVNSPSLTDVSLDCTFPSYLVDEELGTFLPRTERLTPGTRLPFGTQVQLHAHSDKPLRRIQILDLKTEEIQDVQIADIDGASHECDLSLPSLREDVALALTLHDVDGVSNARPFRIAIAVVPDSPPQIDVAPLGIGSAITPQAQLPFRGTIVDDNRLRRAWFELLVHPPVTDPATDPPTALHTTAWITSPAEDQQATLDLRTQQRHQTDPLELNPGDRIILTIKASDYFDLGTSPNIGEGSPYELDVVTPARLLAILETREIGLRRRLEQILEELQLVRNSVIRVRTSDESSANDTSDQSTTDEEATAQGAFPARESDLRLLRIQRAIQDIRRSQSELRGVALAFEDIRLELINNRVDSVKRIDRLQEEIALPLERIVDSHFPSLQQTLQQLEMHVAEMQRRHQLSDQAVEQINRILAALEDILKHILRIETYNELLDIVRSILEDQEQLNNDTRQQQEEQVIDLLE